MNSRNDLIADIEARSGFQLDVTRFGGLAKHCYQIEELGGCGVHFSLNLTSDFKVTVEVDLFNGKELNYETFSITYLSLILVTKDTSLDKMIKDISSLKVVYEKLVELGYNGKFEHWDSGVEYIFDFPVTNMTGLGKILDDFAQLQDVIR